jgi:DNA polymerase-3 subunit beta
MLAGIYTRVKSGRFIMASTDSFRLSEMQIDTGKDIDQVPIIIPEKTATELARLITDDTKEIALYTHESQTLIVLGPIRLTSRLLSGKFPDYESFFPSEYKTKSTILRGEFVNALKQANLVARENNYNTRIRSKHEGVIEISTGDTEIGASSISISGSVEGQEDVIGINSDYLLQTLSVMREDYISIEYKNPLSPIVIKGVPAENGGKSYRHLIMPLKI